MTGSSASDLHRHFRAHPEVVARAVDEEIVLVHLGRNLVYALNRTGARFWELVTENCNPAEALDRMLEEFDVPQSELRAEVEAFLESLLREELLFPAAE